MTPIVWTITWGIVGFLIGILLLFIGGLLLKPVFGPERINGVANYYSQLGMKLIKRSVLIERGTKFDIYKTSHDAEKNADEFSLDGTTAHISNETGLLSTMHKKPFGLGPPPEEEQAVYVSPELGELGQLEAERIEHDADFDDKGSYISDVTLPPERPLVQLRDYARVMIPGSRSYFDLDETVELYKQSQRMFGESKTTQFMILLVAYGGAMLLTWLILTNGGGTVPTGIEVPGI